MENNKGIWIGSVLLVCAAAGLGVFFHHFHVRPPIVKEPPPPPQQAVRTEEKTVSPAPPPKLEQSDDLIRARAKELSSHPKLADWLKTEDLIRRITAAAEGIAAGNSPRDGLDFLGPRKGFAVRKKGERLFLNPRSYTRYNLAAEAFQSLDADRAVRLFHELRPLFQDAYRELGYRDRDFKDTLIRAIKELLRTPVVEGEIPLKEKVVSYALADEKLEGLSGAQKQLLRMGPKNTALIQGKLRELARALGVPENQLPKSQTYSAKVR